MAAQFVEDSHVDHGELPFCPGCLKRQAITKTHSVAGALEVTFSCGHRGKVNPERGTTVSTTEKDGKTIKKIDNRMYLLLEGAAENQLVTLQGEVDNRDKQIAELEAKIAKLEGMNK